MNKQELLHHLSANYSTIQSVIVLYTDGEEETLQLNRSPPTYSASTSNNHGNRSSYTLPRFPIHATNIPVTRSTTVNQNRLNNILQLIHFEQQVDMSFVYGESLSHISNMISLSRTYINMLASINAFFNYQLRRQCQHSLDNTYHNRCEVCSGVIHLLNTYPETAMFIVEVFTTLEQELNYPPRHISTTYSLRNLEVWMRRKNIIQLKDLIAVDKTYISNSIRTGKFLLSVYERTGIFIHYKCSADQFVRLLPTEEGEFQRLSTQVSNQILSRREFTLQLHSRPQSGSFIDVSINCLN